MPQTGDLVTSLTQLRQGGVYELTCESGVFALTVEAIHDGVAECSFEVHESHTLHEVFDGESCRAYLFGWMPTLQGLLDGLTAMRDQTFMAGHVLQVKAYVNGELQGEDLGPNCRITYKGQFDPS